MTITDIVRENKEPFISMILKFLDTLYDKNEADPSAKDYEELRHTIINEKELTKTQENLLLILVTFYKVKFENLTKEYTRATEEFTRIESEIKDILFSKS